MVLEDIPSIEELAEITGQAEEQLQKDREASSRMAQSSCEEPRRHADE
ncbi:hypothetical protein HLRTI_003086 [Halorhabdus tiamatea SARL4B]|uniref:Uncharacterized protein n=1 Tax=Halorhabdus tiamatea SARL4B TaxID=1033806 RepID=S6CV83_9EURY|nr:hypothetical protein [Halorhabdus tiamatea]ERJ04911.1 hypothetical protein HLRTI_003086 [Halorhabdus tiamatea SARL4B]CCQ34969.1 hypothetical protein HTIA_p2867 [Halorhabdus tiamatea SARL4B]